MRYVVDHAAVCFIELPAGWWFAPHGVHQVRRGDDVGEPSWGGFLAMGWCLGGWVTTDGLLRAETYHHMLSHQPARPGCQYVRHQVPLPCREFRCREA